MLIEFNAKIETFDKKDGLTPLIATIIENHMEAFTFLLDQGADILGRRGGTGMTPLMNAIGLQREDIRDKISEYCLFLRFFFVFILIINFFFFVKVKKMGKKEKCENKVVDIDLKVGKNDFLYFMEHIFFITKLKK